MIVETVIPLLPESLSQAASMSFKRPRTASGEMPDFLFVGRIIFVRQANCYDLSPRGFRGTIKA
jgi:hypothetical protein